VFFSNSKFSKEDISVGDISPYPLPWLRPCLEICNSPVLQVAGFLPEFYLHCSWYMPIEIKKRGNTKRKEGINNRDRVVKWPGNVFDL